MPKGWFPSALNRDGIKPHVWQAVHGFLEDLRRGGVKRTN